MMKLELAHRAFDDLTLRELYAILCLRDEVFVVGQKITAEPEVDGRDPECVHVLGRLPGGRLVATARIFLDEAPAKVGRICVARGLQRRGLGRQLMAHVHAVLGQRRAAMSAQAHLVDWYRSLGWEPVGGVYEEAEILHQKMVREPRRSG